MGQSICEHFLNNIGIKIVSKMFQLFTNCLWYGCDTAMAHFLPGFCLCLKMSPDVTHSNEYVIFMKWVCTSTHFCTKMFWHASPSLTFFSCCSWPFFLRCCFFEELRPFFLYFGSNFSLEFDCWGWKKKQIKFVFPQE